MAYYGNMLKMSICVLLIALCSKSFTMPANKAISEKNVKQSDTQRPKISPTSENNTQDFILIDDIIKSAQEDSSQGQHASQRSKLPKPVIRKIPSRRSFVNLRRNIQTAPVRGERPPIRPSSRRLGIKPLIRRRDGRVNTPSVEEKNVSNSKTNTSQVTKLPESPPKQKQINNPQNLDVNRKLNINSTIGMENFNNSEHIMNSPTHQEEATSGKSSTKSSLILGGAISGSAICFFLILMIVVMWMQRSTQSRSQGSIKQIKATEQAKRKRRVPRMKSMREVRDTIFTSFRKVRRPRPRPRPQ